MRKFLFYLSFAFWLGFFSVHAQDSISVAKLDTLTTKELPLKPGRQVNFNTTEGTWISVDVSPDGNKIVFDMMGDLYQIPVSGGKAERITSGMAYDVHPRYSPDGKSLVFISDKNGADNVWIMDLESKEMEAISEDKNQNFFSADWSPDGDYIVAARGRRNIKLHLYHKRGGGGAKLVEEPKDLKMIDPAFSPDGKTIYYSRRTGGWNYNAQFPQYQIGTYDMEKSEVATITGRYGSAFTPTPSPDGKWLVYGSRFESQTGLVIRNLDTGNEEWLAYPIQRDEQESIATLGVLPAMSFTPDSKNLIVFYGGKLHNIDIAQKSAKEIPFEVDLKLDLGPEVLFDYPIEDNETEQVTQIRDAVPSPDGSKLAFTALNRLYIMDFPEGTPKRLTKNDFTESHPAWSPDGNSIAFVSWEGDGGHIYSVGANGRNLKKLTNTKAVYSNPAWSYKHDRIVFTRGSAYEYTSGSRIDGTPGREDLAWIPSEGGDLTFIEKSKGRIYPHFTKIDDRIYLSDDDKLISIRWDGTDEKTLLSVKGITPFGSSDARPHMLPEINISEADDKASKPSEIRISPDGKTAIAKINNDIYTMVVPRFGQTAKISLASIDKASFPANQLTEIGGEFPAWGSDSRKVHWSLGATHFVYDLELAQVHNDSIEKLKKKRKEEEKSKNGDEKAEKDKDDKDELESFKATEYKVDLSYKKDIPQGVALIKGGRIISMKGDEIIENGDILIENNRIVAVGDSGSLDVPNNAKVIDATGKTIVPGFVDTHAHMWPSWQVQKNEAWMYGANLAYGVTTTRDPQTSTTDVLTYSDMVDAGMIAGPRIYSTGPGVGYWAYNLKDKEHAKRVLKQYSEYYDTKTIKMYLTGNRQMRQWIIMAAKELELMPTTEGGLDFKLNMTQLIDGYPGHEHSLPIYPIYKDVLNTAAEAKMAVTPTLLVSYGGPWAEEFYYATEEPYKDKKLQNFTPYEELAQKSRRRKAWFMPEEHVFSKHAEMMNQLIEKGGLVGVGSHGQLQGLGYHWELWSLQSGGMDEHRALKAATILGAESLGLDGDLGSIESGKLADLVILDKNPLENIRHTNTVRYVVMNGRIYDASNLDEIHPKPRQAPKANWKMERPENLPGIEK
ncbi:amidohydrolase family protein [Gramella sp. GC03-9]|uniref:Amidohydrolase family protein n=1 Tax=Christiangramia oceanisediminis TaxID=2920386 RepID=A0A9X2HZE6_9FLAO|nr:amidohydrolase family protein [Gramella oceanisediminis]MCP9198469.1 amidohydrolase family protein [Gramella oceanisediminis]